MKELRQARRGWLAAAGRYALAVVGAGGGWAVRAATPARDDPPPGPAPASDAPWITAYAAFGEPPKYGADFTHFDYVKPDAPKGGTLYLSNPDRRTSFDKFNIFTILGNAPAGIGIYMMETLAALSADETQTMYCLLAEAMQIAPDKSSIIFRIRAQARFSNGDPVTADDVKYSFDCLTSPQALPSYSAPLSGVARAVPVDARTIRFELTQQSDDALFKIGTKLYVFSHKWGLKADGTHKRFDEIVSEYPLMTGAYTIAAAEGGRRIEFKRNADYWARDLPMRRGFFNFDRVVYRFYQDLDVANEAFRAGEYDILKIYSARTWVRKIRGAKWDDGEIVKTAFSSGSGQGLQSYYLNLRRPLFQDIRVRQALNLSYDFENNDRYHLYKRANSIFNNSDFAAQGVPSAGEVQLLEPFRSSLPKEVFGPAYVAPRTDTDTGALRRNLLKARDLLSAAGWKLGSDGWLYNASGQRFEIEYLEPSSQDDDVRMNAWRYSLDKLGIVLRDRKVDFALFLRRLEKFDFDMVTIVEPSFSLPSAGDMLGIYGSKAAVIDGSDNARGVRSPAVDHVLEAMQTARSMAAFRDACRALDRIVMWNYWQVPDLYSDTELATYWNKFGIPAVVPKYFTTDQAPDVSPELAWPISTWWMKDLAKR
ncbi:MAG: ABC transporter substrate-binding protein [Proteobacteria bacterium]|nr:ABC transporter substrate-binding protein [Pseudomonadota bacterium]